MQSKNHLSLTEKTTLTNNPLVSIIITSYNYGRYLADAIESSLNQTYSNIEIIIVDDGSTDNTKKIAEQFPVKYVFEKNQGVAVAKNYGINLSKGEFFICLDGDDKLSPKYVEKTINQILKRSSTGFVYTGSTVWDENSSLENIWMPKRLLSKYSLFVGWHGAIGPIMVRRKAFESLDHGFDPAFPAHEDMDVCFRILSKSWKSDVVYEPIHWYRIHSNSLNPTTDKQKKIASEFMNKRFWFRKPYRKTYDLYEATLDRLLTFIKHPLQYPHAIRKKIRINYLVRSIIEKNPAEKRKIVKIQKEISSTIDMLIDWRQNVLLRKYYQDRIASLEISLKTLQTEAANSSS